MNEEIQYIDWKQISELGLLVKINKEIMHPLGLAICFNPESGSSGGALVSDDGVWEYHESIDSTIGSTDEYIKRIENIKTKPLSMMNSDLERGKSGA